MVVACSKTIGPICAYALILFTLFVTAPVPVEVSKILLRANTVPRRQKPIVISNFLKTGLRTENLWRHDPPLPMMCSFLTFAWSVGRSVGRRGGRTQGAPLVAPLTLHSIVQPQSDPTPRRQARAGGRVRRCTRSRLTSPHASSFFVAGLKSQGSLAEK